MKTFQSKNLHDTRTVGLLKGLTLLFLGASVAVLATYGLSIDPSINNSVQYIQKIILTSDGTASGATGVVLDGSGTGRFAGNVIVDGKVGIGTSNPADTLTISGGARIDGSTFYVDSVNNRVGIGTNSPTSTLYVNGSGIFNGDLTAANGFIFATKEIGSFGTGYFYGNVEIGGLLPSATLDVNGTGIFDGNLVVNEKLGIGMTSPRASLQFSQTVENRKIVLNSANNNDHQFYGFGINGGILRYQIDDDSASHVFYAGTSSTTSDELMRIKGDGNVGIGTSNPQATLDVDGNAHFSGTVQIMPWRLQNVHYTGTLGPAYCQVICAAPIAGGPSTGAVCLAAYDLNAAIMTGCVSGYLSNLDCSCLDHN